MIAILLATAAMVFFRAIQQQNVMGAHYVAAAVTPFGIAAAEVTMILYVVDIGWVAIPWMGAGGALGATAAMWMHRRIVASRGRRKLAE